MNKSGNSNLIIKEGESSSLIEKNFFKGNFEGFIHEFFIHNYLSQISQDFVVPLKRKDKYKLKLIYLYFKETNNINYSYTKEYINLIIDIHENELKNNKKCPIYAKEAFISNEYLIENITIRINSHKNNLNKNSNEYKSLIYEIDKSLKMIKKLLLNLKTHSFFCFSHADSGLHNCALDDRSKLRLIDLEYSGLDSPIKQYIDFLIHPKNICNIKYTEKWSNYFIEERINKSDKKSLNIYNSFFALKWSLILLNEFLPEKWENRLHADRGRSDNHANILKLQLKKAKFYLNASYELLDHANPRKIFEKSKNFFLSESY